MSLLSKREQRGTTSLFLALEAEDFAAQVIAAWDPICRGRPFVVVDQDPDNHKTHVLACSPEARELGIQAGMALVRVRRQYRHVRPLFRNPAWESALLEELRALCYRYTPEFEVREGGAAILDLAGTPALRAVSPDVQGQALLAHRLQFEIRSKIGLTDVALGLAATRLMARVMARQAHPAGLRICPAGREIDILRPMEPDVLPGLSPQCRERIRRYAFRTVGHIQEQGRRAIVTRFGAEGDKLYTLACGMDMAYVVAKRRGMRVETVLEEDLNDDDALNRKVRLTADKLAFLLRKEGLTAAKMTVAIRYSDHKSARKTFKVAPVTDDFKELAELAIKGFRAVYGRRVAVRSISLMVQQPGADKGQTDLFEGLVDRRSRAIGDALVKIRNRRGFAAIHSGADA